MTRPKILVLDRDGVINIDSSAYIRTSAEWTPLPGSIEAIAKAKHAGFTVAVATNQSGVGRGYFSQDSLDAMHAKLQALLAEKQANIDLIVHCPHLPSDDCGCRKPRTGLLEEIQNRLGQSLKHAWFVGDSLKDLQAAEAMEMQPVLVRTGNGRDTEKSDLLPGKTLAFDNLSDAIKALLGAAS